MRPYSSRTHAGGAQIQNIVDGDRLRRAPILAVAAPAKDGGAEDYDSFATATRSAGAASAETKNAMRVRSGGGDRSKTSGGDRYVAAVAAVATIAADSWQYQPAKARASHAAGLAATHGDDARGVRGVGLKACARALEIHDNIRTVRSVVATKPMDQEIPAIACRPWLDGQRSARRSRCRYDICRE